MFITFIYRIGNSKHTYFGKYITDSISDDHDGLDYEVRYDLVGSINKYRMNKNLSELKKHVYIGIISFSSDKYIPVYSTKEERKCFDFYCQNLKNKSEIWMNGKLLK